jgi:hypothetical protein
MTNKHSIEEKGEEDMSMKKQKQRNGLTKALAAGVMAAGLLGLHGVAQAGLVKIGNVVNDTDAHLTWAADMNINGRMTWSGAVAWIASLNSSNYAGYNDWRLPTANTGPSSNCGSTFNPGAGYAVQYYRYGCTGSEMGNLFINLLGEQPGTAVTDQTGDTQQKKDNFALFSNVQAAYYWSGTEYAPDTSGAWSFYAGHGSQGFDFKSDQMYALAVRSGDVVAAVPEPESLALVLVGLAAAGVVRRRRPLWGFGASNASDLKGVWGR